MHVSVRSTAEPLRDPGRKVLEAREGLDVPPHDVLDGEGVGAADRHDERASLIHATERRARLSRNPHAAVTVRDMHRGSTAVAPYGRSEKVIFHQPHQLARARQQRLRCSPKPS